MARAFGNAVANYLSRTGSLVSATAPRPISIGVWFKAAARGQTHAILNNNFSGTAPVLLFLVRDAGGGNDKLSLFSGAYVDSSTFVLSTTLWTHLGVSWNTDDAVAFYINGVATGTTTKTVAGASTNNAVALGTLDGVIAGFAVNGALGELACWNTILDANEWAALGVGISPKRIRPIDLIHYVPIYGIASPENDLRNATTWTVNGTLTPAENPHVQPPFLSDFGLPYVVPAGGASKVPVFMNDYRRRRVN